MSQTPNDRALPKVAAILVVNDGEEWLPSVLRSIRAQDYPNLDLVVVDNGSKDGSRDIIDAEVPPEQVVTFNRSAGFGRAVARATGHEAAREADCLLFLHDDLSLLPDTVTTLVGAMQADASLGIVGPKLREWATDTVLQEVGMTIDRFGRAENRVERGELDQGQLDTRSDVLYVSTAGMLVRADVFAELDGFDDRFPALRDDLDLCWRAWLAGHQVEVVPQAIAYHAAAGSRGRRTLWRDRPWQARFLSERHALAALIKNYGAARLAWALPLSVLLGLAKVVGFAMTRRFADVGATLRAYIWNVVELPRTLRLRRSVQRTRRRTDAELGHLFATGLPRVREYADAMREWLAGSGTPAMLSEYEDGVSQPTGNRVVRFARERPAVVAGGLLGLLYLFGVLALLAPGQLIGGTVLPWPDSPATFLRGYLSPSSGGALATDVGASPVQVIFGALGLATFGNAWLAQRLLVLGLLPVAWLTALRAGRLVTSRRGPRVVGATLYVTSPPVLAALAQGLVGELIAAALMPALVLLLARVANPRSARRQAWRAAAWLALTAALIVAAAPGLWLAVVPLMLVGLVISLLPDANAVARPRLRMITSIAGTLALLSPWLLDLARAPGSVLVDAPAADLPAWRALTLTPTAMPGMEATGGYLLAALTVSVLLLALILGLRLRPLPVTALFGLLVSSSALAWAAARFDVSWVWSPALLLPGALALAGLGVLAARTLVPALRAYTFGLPQLTVVLLMAPLVVGVTASAWSVATGPWEAVARNPELVPPYVSAETSRVGPYRVLLLDEDENEVTWEVTEAEGPSMLQFGAARSARLAEAIGDTVSGVLAGNLDGGRRLGLANIRYVVVADDIPLLTERLEAQPDIEPVVSGAGRVFLVDAWLPRAVALPQDVAGRVLGGGPIGSVRAFAEAGLAPVGTDAYQGEVPEGDHVVVVSEEPGAWGAATGGRDLTPLPEPERFPVASFEVGERQAERAIEVEPVGRASRGLAVAFQAFVLFGLVSLLLRPPGFVERPTSRVDRLHGAGVLPEPLDAREPPLEARLEAADAGPEVHR